MLKIVDKTSTKEIVKCTKKNGAVNFYGVRDRFEQSKAFDEVFPTLGQARVFAKVNYNPPVRETMSESACANIQNKSNKHKRK